MTRGEMVMGQQLCTLGVAQGPVVVQMVSYALYLVHNLTSSQKEVPAESSLPGRLIR